MIKFLKSHHVTPTQGLHAQWEHRESHCRTSDDPLEDWRGHLPVSAYYPCAGRDWSPIEAAGSVDTWLYADYAPFGDSSPRKPLREWLSHPPEGLELELLIEAVPPARLSTWAPWPFLANWDESGRVPVQLAPEPVAMFARYRRPDGSPVRLMYVVGEATATLLAIYGREGFTPWLLCLIQMGYGLGGGWNRFFDAEDPECVLRHALRWHPAGIPPLLLCNSYLPPEEYRVMRNRLPFLSAHATSDLDLRRTHDRYNPQSADLDLLARYFPWFEPALPTQPSESNREHLS